MFKEATARNFMRFKNVTLPLDNQGLVLILGRNEDAEHAGSNGAGKTSLLDMLTWGVWGKTVRNLKHDEVINVDAGKNCHVSVKILLEGVSYVIDRYRKCDFTDKPNDLTLSMNGEDISGASMDATQQVIDRLLGLDFPTFQCMMPGAGLKAAEMTDSKIKELLEKLLRTEAMAAAHSLAKEKVKSLKLEVSGMEMQLNKLTAKIAETQATKLTYEDKIASAASDRKVALAGLNSRKEDLEAKIAAEEKVALKGAEATKAAEALAEESAVPRTEMEEAKILLQKSLKLYAKNEQTYNQAVYAADRDLQRCRKDMSEVNTHCKTCGQEISPVEYAAVMKKLEAKEAYMVEEAERNATEYQEWKEEADRLQASLEADVAAKEKAYTDIADKFNHYHKIIQECSASARVLDTYKASILQVFRDIETKEKETSPYRELRTKAIDELTSLKEDHEAIQGVLAEVTASLELHEFWVDGFSSKGLRSHMLKSVAPILNASAAKYSEVVTGGEMKVTFSTSKVLKSGDTREEFSINVDTKNGADTYKGCSAGEKARVDIIIAFALGDLAQKRAKKRIPFRFLDEPFESIDEEGNEAILALLKSQEDYSTVYCITHKQSFQQLFNKHLWVVKSAGESKIETAA